MTELRDQAAHAFAALLALAPLALWPGVVAGAWAGLCMGMAREITEEGEVSVGAFLAALGSWRDLSFWTLGGLAAGLIARMAA